MSQPAETKEPETKRVSTKHRDLLAAAEVYDVLDGLHEKDRQRVIQWVNEKYMPSRDPMGTEE